MSSGMGNEHHPNFEIFNSQQRGVQTRRHSRFKRRLMGLNEFYRST